MKKIVCSLFISLCVIPSLSLAASEDECSIWLCAPQGFAPSSCNPARKAMVKRAFKGKSLLPSLVSCMKNDSDSQADIKATHKFVKRTKTGEWQEIPACPGKYRRLGLCSRSISISIDGEPEGETYYFNEFKKNI